jgi:hypothetical protein
VLYAFFLYLFCNCNYSFYEARLKPLTLQELCRFKIRELIRNSIELENPDYFKINRSMSTFNRDRKLSCWKSYENNSDSEDSDDYDEDEEENGGGGGGGGSSAGTAVSTNSSLSQFERFFRPRRGQNLLHTSFDNRLRLMIYGTSNHKLTPLPFMY